ncbi:Membrane protein OS=Streptomyces fumanus OX=67302 GN=GCM10018772_54550 PE=4 SV=1 [Streptomyces fumanus]
MQVAVGSSLAIVGGELLSAQRWYWAVLTCWIVFLNTASTGEILVKGYRRLLGTVFGVVAGIVLAGVVGQHTWTAFALVLVFIFAMFYTAPLSYTLMSFFVTAMLGLLTLLHTYSTAVLLLRVAETALGVGLRGGGGGAGAAALVRTDRSCRRAAGHGAVARRTSRGRGGAVRGGPAAELMDWARDLDRRWGTSGRPSR